MCVLFKSHPSSSPNFSSFLVLHIKRNHILSKISIYKELIQLNTNKQTTLLKNGQKT